MTTTFRRISPDEVRSYRTLVQAAYAQVSELGVHFAAADASEAAFEAHLRQNVAWGHYDDGELVATASIRFPWGPNPGGFNLPHFGWIAVDPKRAHQGRGERIIADVEALLRDELHAPAVSLGTAQDHPWLADYYCRQGFRPAGQVDLGLGHITSYFIKPLSEPAFQRWLNQNPTVQIEEPQS